MKIAIRKELRQACMLWSNVSNLRDTGAKSKTMMALSGCAVLLLASCGVKDPIFNTSHPGHAMVTLTTEWNGVGEGVTLPESYTVNAFRGGAPAGYSATLTGVTNKLDHLFEPGAYRFYVYNTPERIKISGTTVSVTPEAVIPMATSGMAVGTRGADDPVRLLNNSPGWLFTSTPEASLTADTERTLTAPMQQQIRQLTLIINPAGDTADKIENLVGMLLGVAETLDMESGTHGAPGSVIVPFSKITSGPDAGKWTATVRLLGVAGSQQRLVGGIYLPGDDSAIVPFDSDLTPQLASFNTDKRQPLTLGGTIEYTSTGTGSTATITDWTSVGGGAVAAD